MTHQSRHFTAREVTLLPTPVRRPRVPVWVASFWPRRAPMRRAARWDGAVPLFTSADHGQPPAAAEYRELVEYVNAQRGERRSEPFEFVVGGVSRADPARTRDLLGPLRDAGAT